MIVCASVGDCVTAASLLRGWTTGPAAILAVLRLAKRRDPVGGHGLLVGGRGAFLLSNHLEAGQLVAAVREAVGIFN